MKADAPENTRGLGTYGNKSRRPALVGYIIRRRGTGFHARTFAAEIVTWLAIYAVAMHVVLLGLAPIGGKCRGRSVLGHLP